MSPGLYAIIFFTIWIICVYCAHPTLYYHILKEKPTDDMPEYLENAIYVFSRHIGKETPTEIDKRSYSVFYILTYIFGNLCEIWSLSNSTDKSKVCMPMKIPCILYQDSMKIFSTVVDRKSEAVKEIQKIFQDWQVDLNNAHVQLAMAFKSYNEILINFPKSRMSKREFYERFAISNRFEKTNSDLDLSVKKVYFDFMDLAFYYMKCSDEIQDFWNQQYHKCSKKYQGYPIGLHCDDLFHPTLPHFKTNVEEYLIYLIIMLSVHNFWMTVLNNFCTLQFYLTLFNMGVMLIFELGRIGEYVAIFFILAQEFLVCVIQNFLHGRISLKGLTKRFWITKFIYFTMRCKKLFRKQAKNEPNKKIKDKKKRRRRRLAKTE